jgi:hypothetical protein
MKEKIILHEWETAKKLWDEDTGNQSSCIFGIPQSTWEHLFKRPHIINENIKRYVRLQSGYLIPVICIKESGEIE